ncbi:MAG: GAF domain-containing protein [Bacteroidota bacterium]
MKLDQRKLSIAFIVVYAACVMISAYSLFTLKDDLIFGSQTLDISDWPAARGVFIKLNFIVFVTMFIGLGAMVFLFNRKSDDVIYVEKKRNDDYVSENDDDNDDDSEGEIDITSLKKAISTKKGTDEEYMKHCLTEICKKLNAGIGALYTVGEQEGKKVVEMKTSYALSLGESQMPVFEFGEGLVGQVAQENKTLNIDDIPEGYVKVVSGLGNSSPTHLLVTPLMQNDSLYGVVEIASFTAFSSREENLIKSAFDIVTKRLSGEEKKAARKTTKKENE